MEKRGKITESEYLGARGAFLVEWEAFFVVFGELPFGEVYGFVEKWWTQALN